MKVAAILLCLVAVASAKTLPQQLPNNFGNSSLVPNNTIASYIISIGNLPISNDHAGTGIIISKNWILTPAYNLFLLELRPTGVIGLPVYAGLTDLSKLDKAQMRRIDFFFKHKQATLEAGPHDIALLHVSKPFDFSESVKPAVLPTPNEQYSGELLTYGWGQNENEYGKDLSMSKGVVMDGPACASTIPAYGPVIRNNVCMVVDACYGVRGSPLVIERQGGVSELVGMASWSYVPCGFNGRPTAYTAVANYIDWISQVQWAYHILY